MLIKTLKFTNITDIPIPEVYIEGKIISSPSIPFGEYKPETDSYSKVLLIERNLWKVFCIEFSESEAIVTIGYLGE